MGEKERHKERKSMNQKASPTEDGEKVPLKKFPFMHEIYHMRSPLLPLKPH